jgi:hypothetical protein
MRPFSVFASTIMAAAMTLAFGCSSEEDDEDENDTAGNTGGAAPGTGGTEATGGVSNTGGTTPGTGGTLPECPFPELQDQGCGYTQNQAQTREVNVLIVLDKSGSMTDTPEGYSMSKWEAVSSALSQSLNQVQGVLRVGIQLFPFTNDPTMPIPEECGDRCCEMPAGAEMNVNIGPGTETVGSIIGAINESDPAGGTPTAYALQRAQTYFTSGSGAGLGGDRLVLLATDGGPNCNPNASCGVDTCTLNIDGSEGCPTPAEGGLNCCTNTPTACLDDVETINAIIALEEAGIRTIVVGIPGADLYQNILEDAAYNGGFTKSDGEPGLYQVPASGGVAELTETFREITTELVRSCEIELTEQPDNLNLVNVAVDCEIIPMGTPADEGDRWYFDNPDDPTKIIIDGPICLTIQQEGVERIDTVFGCPADIIE